MRFLTALACVTLLLYCSGSNREEVRMLFTGDILLSDNVRREYKKYGEPPWQNMLSLFRQSDFVVGNLERGEAFGSSINNDDIAMLRMSGFTTISIDSKYSNIANDHSINYIAKELSYNQIASITFSNSPQFFTIKNVVISLVTTNASSMKNSAKAAEFPSVEIMQKIRLARTLSNVVVVCVHWDGELSEKPNQEQLRVASWLTKRGVDVVVGSHTHVVQKPEMVNGKPVFFSIGSYLLDQKYPVTKDGFIADIRIRRGKIYCSGITTHTIPNSFFSRVSSSSVDLRIKPTKINNLFNVSRYTFWPLSVSDELRSKTNLQVFYKNKKVKTKPLNGLVALDIKKLDGRNEYLFTLERHYSNDDNKVGVRPYIYCFDEKNIYARWRGAALAWPLLDAQILPANHEVLCALHEVDSVPSANRQHRGWRVAAYGWNGIEFNIEADSSTCESCKSLYEKLLSAPMPEVKIRGNSSE